MHDDHYFYSPSITLSKCQNIIKHGHYHPLSSFNPLLSHWNDHEKHPPLPQHMVVPNTTIYDPIMNLPTPFCALFSVLLTIVDPPPWQQKGLLLLWLSRKSCDVFALSIYPRHLFILHHKTNSLTPAYRQSPPTHCNTLLTQIFSSNNMNSLHLYTFKQTSKSIHYPLHQIYDPNSSLSHSDLDRARCCSLSPLVISDFSDPAKQFLQHHQLSWGDIEKRELWDQLNSNFWFCGNSEGIRIVMEIGYMHKRRKMGKWRSEWFSHTCNAIGGHPLLLQQQDRDGRNRMKEKKRNLGYKGTMYPVTNLFNNSLWSNSLSVVVAAQWSLVCA